MTTSAETGLFLDGLHCAGCVGRVERALRELGGVEDARVNHTTHRALVRYDSGRLALADLVARVRELGYEATPFDPDALERPAARDARAALVRLLVAAFLAGNVMVLAAALYIGDRQGMDPEVRRAFRWLAAVLSLPAVTWCAAPFWRGAWTGLRRGSIGIDVPIALGIATAFAASVAATLQEAPRVFADSAATIVFLILLGRTLERGARARASGAVDRLVALAPDVALRRREDGRVEEVPSPALRVGDRVVVPPGARFPADGRLERGGTEVDESLLTGESRPCARGPGDSVTGGSRNVLAEVEVELTRRAGEGTLAGLAALLERAQTERPRVQRLADRVASVFAPAVLGVAAASAAVRAATGAAPLDVALTAAAVLIVACPCALALATPAAVTAAIGRAASLGVLFKSGEALERAASVDTALLDKTGTVTEGHLAVDRVEAVAPHGADAVVAEAAAVEGSSSHPLAEAIRREQARRRLPERPDPRPRRAVPGRGVEAGEGALASQVGSATWLAERGIGIPAALGASARALEAQGATLAFVVRRGEVLGLLALVDPPRGDAREAVRRLGELGIEAALLSGDHAGAAELAGRRAGIAEICAPLLPAEKLEAVRKRRASGARVLVAGDGINDAAALAAADVGVAMARGAEVAVHAADVVVRAPRLGAVPDAVELARAAMRRVRENLGFAVLYNAVAVPLAAVGILEPLHAAIAMSLSSLVVTANAVRLLRWSPGP